MHRFKQIKWLPILMAATILGIAAFQLYWLKKTYEREKRTLEIRTNMAFRETVHRLQATKLKLDKLAPDSMRTTKIRVPMKDRENPSIHMAIEPGDKMIELANVLSEKVKAPTQERTIIFTEQLPSDSVRPFKKGIRQRDRLMQFLYDVDSLQDSVTLKEIDTAYNKRMQQQNINIPFTITRLQKGIDAEPDYNEVTIGFSNPITYRLQLGNTFIYLIKRIGIPILLYLFLVGFTTISFSLLYRNLLHQRRLANIKNEFISNITHELKTPIATVSVAIEALRSFNANMDPKKSKEYLDISANELQRLSLLVDKVLKLSMFENKEIDLKYELLNMEELIAEVTSSMRLQFEKHNAVVNVSSEGDTTLEGDRLHLVSVIFNLLDNALKYSNSNSVPTIDIIIKGGQNKLNLCVRDSGIGIPAEYKDKIFDKFFRVPTGNLHNAKGYGLGLSYVAHVVNKHHGTIKVDSAEGGGTNFAIILPKQKP